MPFSLIATMGQHLEEGTTYIYQITQTQVVQVTVFSAARMSFPQGSRAHSSRELNIIMWRTTKSLESANDNRRQQVKLHDDLNHLLGYNFFKSLTFISIFYIEIRHFLLPATKANYKIPVETHTTLSDSVYWGNIFEQSSTLHYTYCSWIRESNGKTVDRL